MASTYSLSAIRSDMAVAVQESEALTPAYFNRQINNAIQEIALELEFPELEQIDTSLRLAASTRSYSLTTIDPLLILSVKDVTANLVLRMFSREQSDISDETEVGEPRYYYRYGKTLEIYPLTQTASSYVNDTLRIRYIQKPAPLASDTDVSPLPEFMDRTIVDYANYLTFKDLNEPERAVTWLAAYRDAIAKRREIAAREYEHAHTSARIYGR